MTSGMASGDLAEIELLAEVDDFLADVSAWIDTPHSWPPLSHARNVLRRVLARIERLRTRLDAPLVVATFGGTGTGKSTLVNALVGRDVSPSGRQRPTTTQPVLIVGTAVDLERAGLPLEGVVVQRIDVPELDEIILVDCPDPDTAESEDAGTNLARLRALLPFCDVLFYVSTQQKYRSARVGRELSQAAPGCRLVFVQTHADLDADIRNDWRQQLSSEFAVPEMFFVDSRKAVEERAAGLRPTGEFGRLLDLIVAELATSRRLHVRKANLLDLIGHALRHCRDQLQPQLEPLSKLQHALDEQRQQLIERMAGKLQADLSASRGLWERRLLSAVTAHWGTSPFSAVLKLYNSLGNLIASTTLLRARSSVQLALIGTVQGVRWLSTKQAEQNAQERIDRLGALGLDENLLREAQLVVAALRGKRGSRLPRCTLPVRIPWPNCGSMRPTSNAGSSTTRAGGSTRSSPRCSAAILAGPHACFMRRPSSRLSSICSSALDETSFTTPWSMPAPF